MRCGISTACYFPMETTEALKRVADLGAPVTELFLNTFSEVEDGYVAKLLDIKKATGIAVSSVHPYSSAMEGFLFASTYKTRMTDGIAMYRRMFEVCALFGADKLVFHGAHAATMPGFPDFPAEDYARNFRTLAQAGHEYGVTLCHENVSYCRLGRIADVEALGPLFGEYAAYVLDTKQVRRRGESIEGMLDAMGGRVRQLHVSDGRGRNLCLPPGRGDYDFQGLVGRLKQMGYTGDLIIEVYSDGFESDGELQAGMQTIAAMLA